MDQSTLPGETSETLTPQEQAVKVFREQFGGLYDPVALLAWLGIYLRGYGLETGLRQMSDLMQLTDKQALLAVAYLPTLQRKPLSQENLAKLLK